MISASHWARGAYPITPTGWETAALLAACEAVLSARPALLQYRAKPGPDAGLARQLRQRCVSAGVPLLINDDLALARALGTGVHLGRDDGDVAAARTQLGPDAIIGVSVYDDIDRAQAAAAAGASYVSFGRFFASRTKPSATPVQPDILVTARARLSVPIAVIGGITPDNAAPLVARGAHLLASVEGIFGAADPARAVHSFQALLGQP
ncbi:MAG: thiamine phosphate synthase [Abyssibacter sp.]|uniref:thiamine phosphate synthase n=1 Tax=Abyssibacter sp. TaxID=2320200 RepID=UPI00321BB221